MQEHVNFDGANKNLENLENQLSASLNTAKISQVEGNTKSRVVRETDVQNNIGDDELDLAERLGDAHLNILPTKR